MENKTALPKNYSYAWGIVISSIFLLYQITKFLPVWFVGFGVLLLYTLATRTDVLCFIIFMMPQEDLLKISGRNFSVFSYYCLLVIVLFFLKKRQINKTFFVFSCIASVSIIISAIVSHTTYYLLPFLRFLLFLYYLMGKYAGGKLIPQEAIKSYVFGTSTSIVIALFYHAINGTLFSGYFGGIANNRNYYGVLISFCLCVCVLSLFEKKTDLKYSIHLYLCLLICSVGLILSGSRTLIISLVFPALIIIGNILNFKKIGYTVPFVIFFAFLTAILLLYFNSSVTYIFKRFTEENMGTGSGRFLVWQYFFKSYLNSGIGVFFGNGSSYSVFSAGLTGVVAHNTYLEALYGLGVVGLLSVYALFACLYKMICGNYKKRFVLFLPLLNVLFSYFGIDGLFSNQMSILLFLSFLIIANNATLKEKQET